MSKEKIFETNGDINKNAYLNWRTDPRNPSHNLYVMAEGFSEATQRLIEMVIKDNTDKKADSLAYSILYCFDQSIELYLKAIIRQIEMLNGGQISNYKTHDIRSLFNTMMSLIEKKEKTTKGLDKHVSAVKMYIDELYSKILEKVDGKEKVKIDFARYPYDTEGNPHFYIIALENVVVDMEAIWCRCKKIKESLEGLYYKYDEELEFQLSTEE